MLTRSRLILGLCGLALAAPALPAVASPDDVPQATGTAPEAQPSAGAQPPIVLEPEAGAKPWSGYEPSAGAPSSSDPRPSSGYQPSSGSQPSSAFPLSSVYQPPSPYSSQPGAPRAVAEKDAPKPHHHKGLFGWRHCVECQRARVKKHDGVDIPAPPPAMAAMPVQGEMVVSGPVVTTEPRADVVMESQEAGYAVVGPAGDASAPGVAVVGGGAPTAEPTPIGVARGAQNPFADPRMAAMARHPGAGSYDASVVPTSIPSAPQAMNGPGHDRPHIIGHVLGLPQFGRLRRERQAKERQQHAAIAYGDPNQKVIDLPASMVYSKGEK